MPLRFDSDEDLEDFMTMPSPTLVAEMARVDGDLIVLGVSGKMGPTLARMAKRAAPGKRVIGVARFTEPGVKSTLESHGIECISCDLLDLDALRRLPRSPNVVFMAGHKFGSEANASFTWAMNAGVPILVADYSARRANGHVLDHLRLSVRGCNRTRGVRGVPTQPPLGTTLARASGVSRCSPWVVPMGQAGRIVRLSYAIDMRYGVLHDIASAVLAGRPLDVTMGYVNVIWQGDANEQALRLLSHCTSPATPINVTGSQHVSVRDLAEDFGRRFGKTPLLHGQEAATAWIADTTESQQLFGEPSIPLSTMIDWVADWVSRGGGSLGKATHFETRNGKY